MFTSLSQKLTIADTLDDSESIHFYWFKWLCETVNRTSQASRLNPSIPYSVFSGCRWRLLIQPVWIHCLRLSMDVEILDIEKGVACAWKYTDFETLGGSVKRAVQVCRCKCDQEDRRLSQTERLQEGLIRLRLSWQRKYFIMRINTVVWLESTPFIMSWELIQHLIYACFQVH